ncbi:hypothetical protein [Pseudonocardia spirodelae]|uniref:PPE domain-containing protein n=1 Tax=Pseudonocardia spirodelae TaxID=3133431 RepID=A0ABU8T6Z2_9PSEU
MALPRCNYFEAYDLATKVAWITGKPGSAATRQTSDGLGRLVDDMATTKQTLDRGMADLGISWQGPAAEAAQESLTRTANGVDGTATVAANGAARIVDHGVAFERMRARIDFVDPAQYSWVQRVGDNLSEAWQALQGDGTDHVTIAERNQVNDEAANRALRQYESETSDLDDRFTTEAAAGPPAPAGQVGGSPGIPPGSAGPVSTAPDPLPGGTTIPSTIAAGQHGGGGPGALEPGGGGGGAPTVTSAGGGGGSGGSGAGGTPTVPTPVTTSADTRTPPPAPRNPLDPGDARAPWSPSPYRSRVPRPDPTTLRDDRAREFADRSRRQQLLRPGTVERYRGGRTTPPLPGGGRGPGPTTEPHLPGSRGGPGTAWGTESRVPGGRTAQAETWAGARGVEPRGATGGYGPMAGGMGAGRDGQEHRNRYVVPTDEVFDVGVTATDAVLAPEDPGR